MSAADEAKDRELVRELSARAHARGDDRGWFEELYVRSGGDPRVIPWADLAPNPHLEAWLGGEPRPRPGARALVVACGLGDDAERLAAAGYAVTAFDLAPSAIAWCRRRFPASPVRYAVADLLTPPAAWTGAFDLVFEANTLQVLFAPHRDQALLRLADFLAPGGRLLVVARAREDDEPLGELPWPLRRRDLDPLAARLETLAFEVRVDAADPTIRRLCALYRRPGG